MIAISGLLGASFGISSLNFFKIEDLLARGLGLGSASHGLGTAALSFEKDTYPLFIIPFIRNMLISLALGSGSY